MDEWLIKTMHICLLTLLLGLVHSQNKQTHDKLDYLEKQLKAKTQEQKQ